jgi:hypothetical protein
VVSWRTSYSGRSGRGRTSLGNFGAAAQTANQVAGAFVNAVNTAAGTLITAVSALTAGGGSVLPVIWSPTLGIARTILTGAMDSTFDTMRSRVK